MMVTGGASSVEDRPTDSTVADELMLKTDLDRLRRPSILLASSMIMFPLMDGEVKLLLIILWGGDGRPGLEA